MDRNAIPILSVALAVSVLLNTTMNMALWPSVFTLLLLLVALYDRFQAKHSILRNFPLVGRGHWAIEAIRPFLQQGFL